MAGEAPSGQPSEQIEQQIVEDVVQMAIETQHAINERMAHEDEVVRDVASIEESQSTESSEPVPGAAPPSRAFDVVMPEAEEASAGSEDVLDSAASETQEPTFPRVGQSGEPRPYRRLFSDLRRRGMRETA